MGLKLDYKRTFLLGFGFLGVSVLWLLYNTYVPIFLQAGNPAFEATSGATTIGFGLSAVVAGFIMTLDNIAAFFIQPFVGILSDRTRTRIGRRMPYILLGAPVAAVAFALIPVAVNQIPPELSGQTSQLGGPLAFFMIAIGVMLLAMAVFRTPVIALMPDITPSPLRSKANGVINMMGGIGGLLATFGGALLYRIDKLLAFAVGSLILLVAVAVVFLYIKERPPEAAAVVEKKEPWCRGARPLVAIGVLTPEEFVGGSARGLPPSAMYCTSSSVRVIGSCSRGSSAIWNSDMPGTYRHPGVLATSPRCADFAAGAVLFHHPPRWCFAAAG